MEWNIACFTFSSAGSGNHGVEEIPGILSTLWLMSFTSFAKLLAKKSSSKSRNPTILQSCWQRLPGKCDWNRPSFKLLQFVDVFLLVSFRIAWPFHRQTLNVASSSKPNDAWCAWLAQMKQHSNTYSYRWHRCHKRPESLLIYVYVYIYYS